MIEQLPKPENACLVASYPDRAWREIPCVKPPNNPLLPAHGHPGATVGDGMDFSAGVTGHVSLAEGEFSHVTGLKSEYVERRHRHVANFYSLQLNTQFFSTESCASLGSPDPATCYGWEQFVYDTDDKPGAFIEYWLVDFGPLGTKCPSGWHRFAFKSVDEVNCWVNSVNETPMPVEAVTSLEKLRVVGAAADVSRSEDFAEVIVGYASVYYVGGQNWFPDMNLQWQDAEFNIFGDCCGDQATFNTGSTIVVRTEVDSGVTEAPMCESEGFTGETNNLVLTGTRPNWPKAQYPSIVFTETNATQRTQASCATEPSRS
jgi:hypothetical protein